MGRAPKNRNYPKNSLEDALRLPQKIQDEMGGAAMKRLLLAEGLGVMPSSSNYRDLMSSSYKYGLTDGTERAAEISLTELGKTATQKGAGAARLAALRAAALKPSVFGTFYTNYDNKKLPSSDMLPKILSSEYGVPAEFAAECAALVVKNGEYCGVIRQISGAPFVLLEETDRQPAEPVAAEGIPATRGAQEGQPKGGPAPEGAPPVTAEGAEPPKPDGGVPRAIFIGHGKKKGPLQQLQRILSTFQIPHKIAAEEANLGRPIPQKVKDIMGQCGSAILVFTCDEQFFDKEGGTVWRPSENVVHELGAASYAYEDRVVIFKERGLHSPTNYQSIGYIEFSDEGLEARTPELLKELVGFGLIKITTT